jgi:transcriptional regulator with XRE-family HTH domain
MNLGDRIRDLRNGNRWTQEELAEKLSLAKSTISLYEAGKREPDYETIKNIATCFNVTVDFLLGITINPKSNAKMEITLKTGEVIDNLAEMMSRLNESDQQLILNTIKSLAEKESK